MVYSIPFLNAFGKIPLIQVIESSLLKEYFDMEAYASSCAFQTVLQGFWLERVYLSSELSASVIVCAEVSSAS